MERTSPLQQQIEAEAAEWFARLQAPERTPAEREEFAQWLLRSPDHLQEYLAITRAWGDLQLALDEEEFSTESLIRAAREEGDTPDNVIPFAPAESAAHAVRGSPNDGGTPACGEHDTERATPADDAGTGTPTDVEPHPMSGTENAATFSHRVRSTDRSTPSHWRAWAAALLVLGIGILWLDALNLLGPATIRTTVGELRTMTLEDGSTIHLNTDSEIAINLGERERRIDLLRGEARFEVAKDVTRPFLVTTPEAQVRALGTIFNVRAAQARTAVAVLEGRVEVVSRAESGTAVPPEAGTESAVAERPVIERQEGSTGDRATSGRDEAAPSSRQLSTTPPAHPTRSGPHRLELQAGEQAAVTSQGEILPDTGPPLERAVAWTDRRLIFREESLEAVVAEFNRYQTRPLRIADPVLAEHHISGSFATYDVASLLQYLEQYQNVHIEVAADGSRTLTRARVPPEAR